MYSLKGCDSIIPVLIAAARKAGAFVLRTFAPRILWRQRLSARNWGTPDPETKLLAFLCFRDKVSVDVGACIGIYTMAMLCYSRACVTFEARPNQAAELQRIFREMRAPVTVHSAALSDDTGTAQLRICRTDFGLSTISSAHTLPGDVEIITVETHRLDDYGLKNVGCIKIDAEGHEESILMGARNTLSMSGPNIIVELDGNRNPGRIQSVRDFLKGLNYSGLFLMAGRLHPIEEFDPATAQTPGKDPYVSNFIFVQPSSRARLPSDLLS